MQRLKKNKKNLKMERCNTLLSKYSVSINKIEMVSETELTALYIDIVCTQVKRYNSEF